MATYVLLHGAGSDAWYWHRVEPLLRGAGHDVVAVDLPADDDNAGLQEYVDATLDQVGSRQDVIVVAQSMAGFTAPLLVDRLPVRLVVLVAAMVPAPAETGNAWWVNTGHAEAKAAYAQEIGLSAEEQDDPVALFLHDVPPDLAAESAHHVKQQSGTPFVAPWPLNEWPDVPTRFLLCRDDRFFPTEFQRRVVKERLGITPDEMDGGHLPGLARPDELVDWLERYRAEAGL